MNPDHEALREQLGAHALGHLDDGERAALDVHLAGCASCRDELAALRPLAGPLRMADPDRADADPADGGPAADGFAAVLGRIRDERDSGDPQRNGSGPGTVLPLRARRGAATRYRLAAAAAVVALAGLGAGYGIGAGSAGPDVEPVGVRTATPGVQASAGTIAHTWGVEVVLTGTGFAPGQVYRVAVLDRAGRAEGAGAFVGTGAAEMVCRLNSPVLPGQADGFVVTDAAGNEVLRSRFA